MGNAWTYIKEHPWTVAGIIGGIVVLYLLFRMGGAGSSGTAVVAAGPSPEQVQANTALQIAGLQTAAQIQGMAYQLTGQQSQIAGAIAIEQIRSDVELYQTSVSGSIQMAATEAQRQLGLASVTAQQIIALGAQQTEQRQIMAIEAINLASQDTIQQLAYYNAQVQQSGIGAQVAIADINSRTTMYTQNIMAQSAQTAGRQGIFSQLLGAAAAFI